MFSSGNKHTINTSNIRHVEQIILRNIQVTEYMLIRSINEIKDATNLKEVKEGHRRGFGETKREK